MATKVPSTKRNGQRARVEVDAGVQKVTRTRAPGSSTDARPNEGVTAKDADRDKGWASIATSEAPARRRGCSQSAGGNVNVAEARELACCNPGGTFGTAGAHVEAAPKVHSAFSLPSRDFCHLWSENERRHNEHAVRCQNVGPPGARFRTWPRLDPLSKRLEADRQAPGGFREVVDTAPGELAFLELIGRPDDELADAEPPGAPPRHVTARDSLDGMLRIVRFLLRTGIFPQNGDSERVAAMFKVVYGAERNDWLHSALQQHVQLALGTFWPKELTLGSDGEPSPAFLNYQNMMQTETVTRSRHALERRWNANPGPPPESWTLYEAAAVYELMATLGELGGSFAKLTPASVFAKLHSYNAAAVPIERNAAGARATSTKFDAGGRVRETKKGGARQAQRRASCPKGRRSRWPPAGAEASQERRSSDARAPDRSLARRTTCRRPAGHAASRRATEINSFATFEFWNRRRGCENGPVKYRHRTPTTTPVVRGRPQLSTTLDPTVARNLVDLSAATEVPQGRLVDRALRALVATPEYRRAIDAFRREIQVRTPMP